MDQQKPNPTPHVPTEAEIARLEAEAARALRQGGADPEPKAAEPAVPDDFVPYVDDVPEPAPAPKAAKAQAPAKGIEADEEDDEDDEEYIPSEMEKRIDAMTPGQWKFWQIAGGAAVGVAVIAALFLFGQELSAYALILAAVLAILLPRYLERAWRRKLNTARYAMIVAMAVGLVIFFVITGMRTGFQFTTPQ